MAAMRWCGSLRARRRGAALVAGAALAALVSLAGIRVAFADLLPGLPVPTPSPPVALPSAVSSVLPSSPSIPNVLPTPTPSLPVGTGGSGGGCTVSVDNNCVISGGTAPPASPGLPGLPTPSPQVCIGSVACVNPTCITSGSPSCAVATPGGSPPASPSPGGTGTSSTGTGSSTGSRGTGSTGPGQGGGAGTFSGFGSGGGGAAAPAAAQAAAAVDLGAVPVVQQLGVLPGLSFGHVALLIPLFIGIDVLAGIGLIAVVRRYWAAPAGD